MALPSRRFGEAMVHTFASKAELGAAAARLAARVIREAIERDGRARIVVAAANSQLELIDGLVQETNLDWTSVDVFHMDEYVGISADHPASFRRWVRDHVANRVQPGTVHYLAGDAVNLLDEMEWYARLLSGAPLHLAFVGFGENGHIAFNDPPVADFSDPLTVKRVALDEDCRRQQVGEGHFPDLEAVPCEAVTVTCPGLFRAAQWICCVPDARKAWAARCALEGAISTACPASLVRRHPNAAVFLDQHSAALLAS